MKDKKKIEELEEWIENISFIQHEILKVLGYKIVNQPKQIQHPYLSIEKISEEKANKR